MSTTSALSKKFLFGYTSSGATTNLCRRCLISQTRGGSQDSSLYRNFTTSQRLPAKITPKAKSTPKINRKPLTPPKKTTAEPAVLPAEPTPPATSTSQTPPVTKPILHSSSKSKPVITGPSNSEETLKAAGVSQHVVSPVETVVKPIAAPLTPKDDPTASVKPPTPKETPITSSSFNATSARKTPAPSPSSILKPEPQKSTIISPPTQSSSLGVEAESTPTQRVSPIRQAMADTLGKVLPSAATESYVAYAASEALFKECRKQGEYFDGIDPTENAKFWYTDCGLPVSLYSWAQITTLHMWMIMVRLRYINPEPRDRVQTWQQHFVNHLFYDLEDMMVGRYNIKSSSRRTGYLKEFNEQFRGAIAAYDEGMVRGDATLATALWRNLWDVNAEVDFQKLAIMVSYVRRIVSGLENVGDDVILSSKLFFGNPEDEQPVVVKLATEGRRCLETWKPLAKVEETPPS